MKNRNILVGIDVDGVLADFTGRCAEICRKEFDVQLDLTTWGLGLTKAQENWFWGQVDMYRNFWESLKPLSGPMTIPPGVTPIFITKRANSAGDSTEVQTARWLYKYQEIGFPTVLATSYKAEVCAALKVGWFVDDKVENCEDVLSGSPETKVFVFDQPWNQYVTHLPRVKSMEEFFEYVVNG